MTLLDKIYDRNTDRQIVDRKAPRLFLDAESNSNPTYWLILDPDISANLLYRVITDQPKLLIF